MDTVSANDGALLPLASLPTEYGYDGDGNLTTVTVVYNTKTYVQTLAYTDGNLTSSSQYEVQP